MFQEKPKLRKDTKNNRKRTKSPELQGEFFAGPYENKKIPWLQIVGK